MLNQERVLRQPGKLANSLYPEDRSYNVDRFPKHYFYFYRLKGRSWENDPHCTTYLLDKAELASLPGCLQNSLLIQHRTRYSDGFAPEGIRFYIVPI